MANDWTLGQKENTGLKKEVEQALLVGLIHRDQSEEQVQEYLDELEFLAATYENVATTRTARTPTPTPITDFFFITPSLCYDYT